MKKTKDIFDTERAYSREELAGRAPAAWQVTLATLGLLAVAAGTLLPIVNVTQGPGSVTWWKYVYAAGALMFLAAKLLTPYTGLHPRVRRLWRIEAWAGVFFCVAAFFLFYNGNVSRDSWAFTLAGGALIIFTTIAIPRTVNRQLRRQASNTKK